MTYEKNQHDIADAKTFFKMKADQLQTAGMNAKDVAHGMVQALKELIEECAETHLIVGELKEFSLILYTPDTTPLVVGSIIEFIEDRHLEFPLSDTIEVGTRGIVLSIEDQLTHIFLDRVVPDLVDEWNNVLQTSKDSFDSNSEWAHYRDSFRVVPDGKLVLDADRNDGILDLFIRAYCTEKGYRVDGDIFSHAFSMVDNSAFDTVEAMRIIDAAAANWGLVKSVE